MIRPGLTSVTFRKLAPAEIVRWAAKAGLDGIEWGGDVHVPHGDVETAREVAGLTRDAGLAVSSYGSYYRVGQEEPDVFRKVLDTALALEAPIIRVWAGRKGSADADDAYRTKVAEDGRRIAELAPPRGVASAEGVLIATEWHSNTLTDTAESATALFEAVGHEAFRTYWQPRDRTLDERMRDLAAALPRLAGLHVHHSDAKGRGKAPLGEGESVWLPCLEKAATAGDMFALLEFVMDEDPEQMVRDAAALRGWLSSGEEG